VQMMVYRYRGHQYHYSGHCVSFMQNTAETVDMLPNLPSELDIVVLRPSDLLMESNERYRRQFRSAFRLRRDHVITWLRYLKANHPDYRYVTISLDRLDTLPVDDDVSSSFISVIDEPSDEEVQAPPVSVENAPPNSQSMVPNLNVTLSCTRFRGLDVHRQVFQHQRFDQLRSMKQPETRGSLRWPSLHYTPRA
jgi:hypothetical protein